MKTKFSLLFLACVLSSATVWANPKVLLPQDFQVQKFTALESNAPSSHAVAPKTTFASHDIQELDFTTRNNAPRRAKADDNQCGDNLFWEVTDNALTITGSGDMWDYYGDAPWGRDITSATLSEGVTSIGNYAFYWCRSLVSVSLPSTVKHIGQGAFYACTDLPEITFSDDLETIGNYAFTYCWSIQEVALKDKMSYIGTQAFMECNALTTFTATHLDSIGYQAFAGLPELKSISLPEGLQKIEQGAFNSCNNLKVANLPSTVTEMGPYVFSYDSIPEPLYNAHLFAYLPLWYEGAYEVPAGIEIIVGGSFLNCKKLSAITLPEGIKEIRQHTFGGCDSLKTVTIPNNVEAIGDYAFTACRDLQTVTMSNNVKTIGMEAFCDCKNLESITWSTSLESIGSYAFVRCEKLNGVTLPATLKSIEAEAFWGCVGLTSIAIPDAVEELGRHTFTFCSGLQNVTIGNNVPAINQYTFYGCSNLEEVIGGDHIAFIDSFAFYNCENLSSITLSPELKHIGYAAFAYCATINPLTVPDGVKVIEDHAFYNIKNVLYHGEAEGSPWGAFAVNGTTDGYLIFSDETKTVVVHCDAYAEGAIVVPDGVKVIEDYAFRNCTNITSVSLPNTLDSIGYAAFLNCTKLESVDFGNHLKFIETGAFSNCLSLKEVALPASLRRINSIAFRYDTALTSVSLQEGIEIIGAEAFLGCTKLSSFNLPESVNWIDNLALYQTGITTPVRNTKIFALMPSSYEGAYEIPDGTEWIATAAFYNCKKLTEISLPNSLDYIYASAFDDCSGLRNINCSNKVPWLGEDVFYNVDPTDVALHVPDSITAINYRKAEQWQNFIIHPIGLAVPTEEDLTAAGYDIENDLVLCYYFHVRPLENVVLGGNYNNWSDNPAACVSFKPLDNFDGWFVTSVPGDVYDVTMDNEGFFEAKPVHLKDGEFFDWYFQAGDQYAWLRQGTNIANVGANDAGEAKILSPAKGAYIYDMLYWRHDPSIPVYIYTIQVYSPDTCADMRPGLIGSFYRWENYITMPEIQDEHGRTCYAYSFKSDVGSFEYTFIEGHSERGDWSNRLMQKVNDEWTFIGNFNFPDAQKDTTIVHDFSDNTQYAYQQCLDQLDGHTAIEEIFDSSNPQIFKILRDGQLFIFRDEQLYTITGQKVQ